MGERLFDSALFKSLAAGRNRDIVLTYKKPIDTRGTSIPGVTTPAKAVADVIIVKKQ
jgi:hypothetical protein